MQKKLLSFEWRAIGDNIWIKYGGHTTLAEAAMQCFIHQNADPSLVRVPAVYDCFTHHRPSQGTATFIVMDKVDGETFVEFRKNHPNEADSKIQAIIDAVHHIWTIPVPSGASSGPLGGKTPDDHFFASNGAGQDF